MTRAFPPGCGFCLPRPCSLTFPGLCTPPEELSFQRQPGGKPVPSHESQAGQMGSGRETRAVRQQQNHAGGPGSVCRAVSPASQARWMWACLPCISCVTLGKRENFRLPFPPLHSWNNRMSPPGCRDDELRPGKPCVPSAHPAFSFLKCALGPVDQQHDFQSPGDTSKLCMLQGVSNAFGSCKRLGGNWSQRIKLLFWEMIQGEKQRSAEGMPCWAALGPGAPWRS